ncbi:MAG: L-lactate dehydrogenase [Kosmotoga sp.]|nr:MAG: L-lactate dehydrogenase [Kosmotoga sp.]
MNISIIGAGMVGSSIAYASMIKGIVNEINLVDINEELAEGQAMDLKHGNPYTRPVVINGGGYDLVTGSDIVIVTAGKPQKPGETRLQLLESNASIMANIVSEVMKRNKDTILLIVSNPVDVLTWVAWKKSGLPRDRVFGSGTTLDTARLRQNIAQHCKLDPRSVHAYVLGEHGDSEIASWSTANIGGTPIKSYCRECKKKDCPGQIALKEIFESTKKAAYQIIQKKGSTCFGIGLAVSRILEVIAGNQHSVLTVSTIHNKFDKMKNIPFSVPSVVGWRGIERILPLNISEEERDKLVNSAEVIENAINKIKNYI